VVIDDCRQLHQTVIFQKSFFPEELILSWKRPNKIIVTSLYCHLDISWLKFLIVIEGYDVIHASFSFTFIVTYYAVAFLSFLSILCLQQSTAYYNASVDSTKVKAIL